MENLFGQVTQIDTVNFGRSDAKSIASLQVAGEVFELREHPEFNEN